MVGSITNFDNSIFVLWGIQKVLGDFYLQDIYSVFYLSLINLCLWGIFRQLSSSLLLLAFTSYPMIPCALSWQWLGNFYSLSVSWIREEIVIHSVQAVWLF